MRPAGRPQQTRRTKRPTSASVKEEAGLTRLASLRPQDRSIAETRNAGEHGDHDSGRRGPPIAAIMTGPRIGRDPVDRFQRAIDEVIAGPADGLGTAARLLADLDRPKTSTGTPCARRNVTGSVAPSRRALRNRLECLAGAARGISRRQAQGALGRPSRLQQGAVGEQGRAKVKIDDNAPDERHRADKRAKARLHAIAVAARRTPAG